VTGANIASAYNKAGSFGTGSLCEHTDYTVLVVAHP